MSESEPFLFTVDHGCFGCGAANAGGLQLRMQSDPDSGGVFARCALDSRFQGYDGMIHGGIVSTVLDEVMAWSLYGVGVWAVTAGMTVRFRRPVAVDLPLVARGWIVTDRRRVYDVAGRNDDASTGETLADATATFVKVPEHQATAWRERYLASRPPQP